MRPAAFQPALSPLTKTPQTLSDAVVELLGVVAMVLAVMGGLQWAMAGDLDVSGVLVGGGAGTGKAGAGGDKAQAEERALGERVHTLHRAQTRWLAVAFARVVGMGALVAWMYLVHADRAGSAATRKKAAATAPGGLAGLANQVVFTMAMGDMLFWGYMWTVLREERREVMAKVARWREERAEEDTR